MGTGHRQSTWIKQYGNSWYYLSQSTYTGFCSGVAIGLTYGKSLPEAADIGARLASSVITVTENTCPRFLPQELGLDVAVPV